MFFFPNFSVNNITTGGSFNHKTIVEGEALLDHILKSTLSIEPLHVEAEPSHEKVSSAEVKPIPPMQRPSNEPETPEEGFQPSNFPFFEDELFQISWKYLESLSKTEVDSDVHILASLDFDLLIGYP